MMPPARSFNTRPNKNESSIWGDSQFSDQIMLHSGLDDIYDSKVYGEDDNCSSVGYGDDADDLEDDDRIVRQVLLRSNSNEPKVFTNNLVTEPTTTTATTTTTT